MNSCWKGNLIIFTMALVPNHSDHQMVPLGVNVRSNLVKVDKNLRVAQICCKSMKNDVLGGL